MAQIVTRNVDGTDYEVEVVQQGTQGLAVNYHPEEECIGTVKFGGGLPAGGHARYVALDINGNYINHTDEEDSLGMEPMVTAVVRAYFQGRA